TSIFCSLDILLNRLHRRISRAKELAHRFWNFVVSQPAKFTHDRETIRFDRLRPGNQCICETDVVSGSFRPEQINFWKDTWNVFHIHAMRAYHLGKCVPLGTLAEAIQEWLISIYCMN